MRIQHPDRFHARPVRGLDAGWSIFDDEAVLRHHAQALGGSQKDIGIGFAALDVSAGDHRFEGSVEMEHVRNGSNVFRRRRRSDRLLPARCLKALDPRSHAGQQFDALRFDEFAVACFFGLIDMGHFGRRHVGKQQRDDLAVAHAHGLIPARRARRGD